MVKNLNTIDRGTKVRLGRWHNDDQADNTIVINASDTPINASNANALYMKPIRSDPSDSTLMTGFDPNTYEIVNTGLRRDDVAPREVDYYANIGNTFTSTIKFEGDTSLTTEGVVGIANIEPIHTLDVGTKFYVDEEGANVLTVLGDTYVQDDVVIGGNLDVRGTLTSINTENTTIKDAIIELGKGNTSSDIGIIMDRPDTNVVMGYRDTVDEFVIAHTTSSATSSTITPSSELINARVHGRLHVNSNLTVDTDTLHVDAIRDRVGINTLNPHTDLDVVGGAHVHSDFAVDTDTLFVDASTDRVGINTLTPSTDFHVEGETYVSGNVTVDTDTFHVDTVNDRVGINTLNPTTDFHVEGDTYVSGNVDINTDLTVTGNGYIQTDLSVTGNAFVSSNVVVTGNTDVQSELNVAGNAFVSSNVVVTGNTDVQSELNVTGNAFVSSNVVVTGNVDAQSELNVTGNAYVASNVVVTGNVDVQTNLNVLTDAVITGNTDVQSELNVTGNAFVSSNVVVTGNTDVQSELNVTGNAFVSSNAVVTGNVDVQSELNVTGNAFMSSNIVITGNTDVQSELNVTGNAFMSSNIVITGNTDVQSELNVTGNAFMSSNVVVTGNTDVQSELNVTGNAFVSSNLNAQSELNVTGNAFISSDVVVTGNTDVQSELNVTGNAFVFSNLNAQSELNVTGNAFVSSNLNAQSELNVTGNAFVSSNVVVTGNVDVQTDVNVTGNVYATGYYGDGGLLSNVTLQVVSDHGNTTSNTIQFTNPTTALVTDLTSSVGIKVDQLYNVNLDAPAAEQILVYDGTYWVNEYPVHTYIKIRNDAGVDIESGDAVYVRGTHNANILNVGLAQSNSPGTMPCIGLSNQTLTPGQEGTAVAYGKALSVVTEDFIAGETVYVSNTVPGGLSNIKPYNNDLIQNVGVVTKVHESNGGVFVTGIGRANDIPNAPIVLDETDINYVYVNNQNNDFKKIEPSNLLTQLQTLQQVTDTSNTTSNTIQFTNATTGIVTTGNVEVGSNISVTGLADPINKYLPMVGTDGFLEKSPIYFTSGGTYVVTAAEAEFLGNLTLSGNTTILNSESVTISDRIFGIGANNAVHSFDTGVMMEHKDDGEYANVALIYHAVDHRFAISYTQNTFTDEHILDYEDVDHVMQIDLIGNVEVQHNFVVNENVDVTGTTILGNNLTVGAASNLFVDVSTSRVGINEGTPSASLDVGGDARIQDTTDSSSVTTGALVVSGGLGVASNIHSTNVYAGSHIGVGTDAAIVPVHVIGTDAGGVYINGDGNDARVTLEATGITSDPVTSFIVNGGESFSVGIDNSQSDTFNISNHATDVGTNARLTITPSGTMTLTNTETSLITAGSVGIANTAPIHDLDVGSNLYVDDTGSNVVHVSGNVYATQIHSDYTRVSGNVDVQSDLNVTGNVYANEYYGDGGLLSNIDLQVVTDYGNATSNTIQFINPTTSLVTSGSVGIANTVPIHDLDVGSNLYIEDTGSNVVHVTGSVYATRFVGDGAFLENIASNLHEITTNGNVTTNTVQFDGSTALVTTGNVGIANAAPDHELSVTGNVYVSSEVNVVGGLVTNLGGLTKKTYGYSAGTITASTTPEINVVFDSQLFSAKITAHLVEPTSNISVLNLDVTGGTGRNIGKGFLSIVGDQNSKHWDSTINTTDTTVTLTPSVGLLSDGTYGVHVEYTSPLGTGGVTSIDKNNTNEITFDY